MHSKTALTTASTSTSRTTGEQRGLGLMVAGGLLLGTLGVFVQEAAQHPLVTVWFRCAMGALALFLWCAATGNLKGLHLQGRRLGVVCVMGCLMVLNWALFFAAIPRTSMAVATVVFHIQPIWVIVFGALFLRERVSWGQWMATPVALCGLALTTGLLDDLAISHTARSGYALGLLLCLGGSLSYAAVTLLAKTQQGIAPLTLAFWQCAVGSLVLVWAPWVFGLPQQPGTWAWLAGLGVLHTGLAYVVLFAGMARLPLGRIAVLQFVYPLAAVLFDWGLYGTRLSPTQLAGMALMGASVWSIVKTRHAARPALDD